MVTLAGKMRKPEPNKKKIAIIVAIIAVVCLSASGGLYLVFKDKAPAEDQFGRRMRQWHDANTPNPQKQTAKQIMDYRNSDKFKQLSQQEQFMYTMAGGRKVMDYQMETYFTLPKEQKTAYLDKMIDDMRAMRSNMDQMRAQNPPRRPRDANDPNRQARQATRQAQRNNPSNARSRAERGTALQRAQREQFFTAMRARMQQRGISMPAGRGGGPGGPGGR